MVEGNFQIISRPFAKERIAFPQATRSVARRIEARRKADIPTRSTTCCLTKAQRAQRQSRQVRVGTEFTMKGMKELKVYGKTTSKPSLAYESAN